MIKVERSRYCTGCLCVHSDTKSFLCKLGYWAASSPHTIQMESKNVIRPDGCAGKIVDGEIWFADRGLDIESRIKLSDEDVRQRSIWGNQRHHTHRWNTILGEEVGELAKAINEENLVEMEKEGIQVATLALKISHMAKKLREQRKESDNGKED